jgi:hypothetical protein
MYTVTMTPPLPATQTVSLPGVVGDGMFINVITGNQYIGQGTQVSDARIVLNPIFTDLVAMQIINMEMTQVRKDNPDVDFDKTERMISSVDHEMFNLGIKLLAEYTKYTWRLVQNYSKDSTIQEFISNNKYNLTGKIK